MRVLRNTIKKKAQFDIKDLEVVSVARECFVPALFVHGQSDIFVRPHHSEELYDAYGGDKMRILVEGDHNSMRPQFFLDSAVIFFCNTLLNGQPQSQTESYTQSAEEIELLFHNPSHQDNHIEDEDHEDANGYILQNNSSKDETDNHVNGVVAVME